MASIEIASASGGHGHQSSGPKSGTCPVTSPATSCLLPQEPSSLAVLVRNGPSSLAQGKVPVQNKRKKHTSKPTPISDEETCSKVVSKLHFVQSEPNSNFRNQAQNFTLGNRGGFSRPPGIVPYVLHGSFSIIGNMEDDPEAILKYPKWRDELSSNMFDIEAKILQHLGSHPRIVR